MKLCHVKMRFLVKKKKIITASCDLTGTTGLVHENTDRRGCKKIGPRPK